VNPVATSRVMIQSPAAGDTLSGAVQIVASVATSLDAAGSYLTVDGLEIGTARVTGPPYNYFLDTNTLAAGAHTLQIWAHSTDNEVLLSNTVPVIVNAAAAPVMTTPAAPVTTVPVTISPVTTVPVVTAPAPTVTVSTKPAAITFPTSGQAIGSALSVAASIQANLDAAGSYLMVDGQEYGYQRVGSAPYLYTLDPAFLAVGTHTLQVWAHTTNNETLVSDPVAISVVR
ncbi:MAG: Ig-like domain-containing protein, partial [Janthinobacterium lividum]